MAKYLRRSSAISSSSSGVGLRKVRSALNIAGWLHWKQMETAPSCGAMSDPPASACNWFWRPQYGHSLLILWRLTIESPQRLVVVLDEPLQLGGELGRRLERLDGDRVGDTPLHAPVLGVEDEVGLVQAPATASGLGIAVQALHHALGLGHEVHEVRVPQVQVSVQEQRRVQGVDRLLEA